MQILERLLIIPFVVLAWLGCQNQTATVEQKPAAPVAAGPVDTLVGFKGAERAGIIQSSVNATEYEYQHYTVNASSPSGLIGQRITVFPKDGSSPFTVPETVTGFFAGISRHRLFIDIGTGPDNRELVLFNLKTSQPVMRTNYVGEPEIMPNGKLWYLRPAEEKDITKMPECPERAEWEKNGLTVAYGRVCSYDLNNDAEIKKNEWRCVAQQ